MKQPINTSSIADETSTDKDQCNPAIDFRILSPPRTVTDLYIAPEWRGLLLDFWFHWENRARVNASRESSAAAQLGRLSSMCGSFQTQMWCTPLIGSQTIADTPTFEHFFSKTRKGECFQHLPVFLLCSEFALFWNPLVSYKLSYCSWWRLVTWGCEGSMWLSVPFSKSCL